MKAEVGVLLAVASLLGVLGLSDSLPVSPERAKNSVLVVETTVEVSPNSFFFSKSTEDSSASSKQIAHYGGTAFVVDGHLITAAHVVTAGPGEKVLSIHITTVHGQTGLATVARTDKADDLAELDFSNSITIPSLTLSSHPPQVGDSVVEVGHPGMIQYVVSRGILVGFDSSQGYNIATLDTFGGNSGGPVMNSSCRVIGVTHTILNGSRFTGIGTYIALRSFLYPNQVR